MPRRRQHTSDDALGLTALVIGALLYRQLSAISVPWKIALAVGITSVVGTMIVWAVRVARRRRTQQLLRAAALSLTPTQFEEQVQHLLRGLGWEHVARVGGRGDGGVDLRGLYRGQRWIVQCKRYQGRVAPAYLRDLEGARSHERADRALLVTTGRFTRQGYAWARGKPIELWDGTILAQRLDEQRQRLHGPERRRTRWLLGCLAAANGLVLLWAAMSAPVFVPTRQDSAPRPDPPRLAAPPAADEPIAATEADVPDTCGTATIRGVERLVLRSAPGLASEKVADYPAGTIVTLGCAPPSTANGLVWQPVQVDDRAGWMSQRMLQVQP